MITLAEELAAMVWHAGASKLRPAVALKILVPGENLLSQHGNIGK